MKLVFLTLILMLGLPSAFAAERYTEVWNPPEAQATKGKTKARPAIPTASKKKRKSGTAVKQVADKAAADPQTVLPSRGKGGVPRQSAPSIPRIIGPNGLALQV